MSRTTVCKMTGTVEARFGWDAFPKQYSGGLIGNLANKNTAIDCDARAVFCRKDGKPISDDIKKCCVYYDNKEMFENAVMHGGDNQTGGNGDDEQIVFDLGNIPSDVDQIVLSLDLFKEKKKIGLRKIQEAFLRIIDIRSGEEITRMDFGQLNSSTKIVLIGKVKRSGNAWSFVPDGSAFSCESMEAFLKLL